ncbi:polyprenyl synthetase family protein [Actinomadura harenae]|uniref:polyprenyl synthetase family protein n=1 Tax=Actinomadura harenae TaxID=2483351 RepID=UPI0018F2EB50|nr:polyprenyl synthetase family protein [Actinomadura harenae]
MRSAVEERLAAFLDTKASWAAAQCFPAEVTDVLRDLVLGGGKRIRPVLCVAGWRAAGGCGDQGPVLRVAVSLEMFHAFALVHDDVMDRSATRRGRPSAHEALAARHVGRPSAARLGANAALLLGDLALAWSDELLHTAGLSVDQFAVATAVLDEMRTELMYGQYLDLLATGWPSTDLNAALRIIRFKGAKYTAERPLQLGAVLAGADAGMRTTLSEFGLPLGEAFQLRDDLLGVFGHREHTGKPNLDDLREGKATVLMALALERSDSAQRTALRRLVGDPALDEHGAQRARDLLTATGAVAAVEEMIADRHRAALRALDGTFLHPTAVVMLRELAAAAVVRSS